MAAVLKSTVVLVALALTVPLAAAQARDEWQINKSLSALPADPRFQPGGVFSNQVKPFDPNFWRNQMANRIPAGTVLTAILEDDLNSAKNKRGDTFTLTLQDGFELNGKVLIPPNSKIIGSVNFATPASKLRNGNPGRMDVSLQSLVFPDGRHMPIFGFIDSNPNLAPKKPPRTHMAGMSLRDYGQQIAGMGLSFVSGPGVLMNWRLRGQDFKLSKGAALPIRLNRELNVPQQPMIAPPVHYFDSTIPGAPAGMRGASMADPSGPIRLPGFAPVTTGGANGMPPTAPPAAKPADPNEIFNTPLKPQVDNLPDPF